MSYQSAATTDERLEAAYIAAYGEGMVMTIAETWIESLKTDNGNDYNRESRLRHIRNAIVKALDANLSDLEIAETAADLCGNPSYEEFSNE